jgi:hypothetical protein
LRNSNVNIGTSGAEIGGAFGEREQVAENQDLMLENIHATSN